MAVEMFDEIPGVNMRDLRLNGFKVHELPATADIPVSRGRRDYYKMGLVTGDMTIGYGGRLLELKDSVLFFVNPNVPRYVVRRSADTTGYACIFTETFIKRTEILKESPLFQAGDSPLIRLNAEQVVFMTGIFRKMLTVYNGDYAHKGDLVRNCIELIIHEALRIQPSQHASPVINAATRITHLFMDLLERQFPIERSSDPLLLRTAQDFAEGLSVHVNYLNRSVKEVTGKPTSVHIAERVVAEAKDLLQHTDWSVADIAYALGFDYPTYFNNYFKRVTGSVPRSFRKV
ncbi:helix-turn-helix domain-containing protein [Mucilaginibacter sp. 22184]|uniref:helix-turn-helix domain-containing protein n=1 Tax=Mucilaginibacter sp. 22184 TaxID=3453887 RepID=UPI003F87AE56